MKYEIVRSNRKTTSIEVKRDGCVVVRAPYFLSVQSIEQFVREKADWIERARADVLSRPQTAELPQEEIKRLADLALKILPPKVEYYSKLVGVTYGRITVRHQKTKWGSCSSKGNLNFNCMLMTLPERVIDYVVVHELCHRKQMNHSPLFWNEVARILPDYKQLRAYLKNAAL